MKLIFLISLVLFIQSGICAWTTPLKLTSPTVECTFPQMYIDPKTHVTHMVWIDNPSTDFRLIYAKKYPDKNISSTTILEDKVRPRLSQIIGEGDGNHILISYDAKRTQGDKFGCGGSDTKGCTEIHFIESFNGGDTWSKSVKIAHDNPNDAVDRKGPRLIYVKEIKKTIITYWSGGPMAYSIRDGTGDFSKEIAMPLFGTMTAYQSIFYTVNPSTKKITLHFTYSNWKYPNEWLMYSTSVDEGKTWEKPRELTVYRHQSTYDSYLRSFSISNSDIMPTALFTTFVQDNEIKLMWSLDEGKIWTKPIPTHRGNALAPRIQLCRQPNNEQPKVHLLFGLRTPQNKNSFIFGTLDMKTSTYKDNEFPFAGMTLNWDYVVDCYVEDNKKSVVTAILESFDESLNSIFLSFNDNPK